VENWGDGLMDFAVESVIFVYIWVSVALVGCNLLKPLVE
jgi:hypothetical protein